jgi:L-ascorbate metabolism protein UlaG (beta-lactamase superfamily)
MKFTWLGHSGFRIEFGDKVLLLDPWLRGNPVFDEANFDAAIAGATHILLTHGHFDHACNAAEISKATGAPLVGVYDLITWLSETEGVEGVGFNKGGTVDLGGVKATLVHAVHSNSTGGPNGPLATGSECGFMIEGEGKTVYVMGDTDVHSDMALFQELHAPQIGIVPMGGHFTMDAKRAAFACNKFFNFTDVLPCHYKTFVPPLAPSADEFAALMSPTKVHAPDVMGSVEI